MNVSRAKSVCCDHTIRGDLDRILHLAFLAAILRWPDLEQARGFVDGFYQVADLPSSGIFKPARAESRRADSFLHGVAAKLDRLLASKPRPDADEIWN